MSIDSILFRIGAGKSDRKRDSLIPIPSGVEQTCNISYGKHGRSNLLDVYHPQGKGLCPVIVNVHGGGYVYGSKEIYKRYCMDLARRGFTVVNINYRLAPRWKFPAPLEDLHNVFLWLEQNAAQYHADLSHVFMVGDSAGAQLVSQYAAMLTSAEYMALFGLPRHHIKLTAVGLNCGVYDMGQTAAGERKGISLDYLGRKLSPDDPRFRVLENIGTGFPPAHITTACHDFLHDAARPMYDFLTGKGIPCRCDCYGSPEQEAIGHVFHINILLEEAKRCNDDQCAFFRSFL